MNGPKITLISWILFHFAVKLLLLRYDCCTSGLKNLLRSLVRIKGVNIKNINKIIKKY